MGSGLGILANPGSRILERESWPFGAGRMGTTGAWVVSEPTTATNRYACAA